MSTLALNFHNHQSDYTSTTSSISLVAKKVEKSRDDAFAQFTDNVSGTSRKDKLFNYLMNAIAGSHYEGWDGYDAQPVSLEAIRNSFLLALSFSCETPLPEFTPESDGEIAIEWYGSQKSVFSISVGKSNILSYSGVYSDGTDIYGKEKSDKLNVEFFENLIQKVFN